MGILAQKNSKLDLGASAPRQPSSTRPLSEHIFCFHNYKKCKVKVSHYRQHDARELCVF